MDFALRGKYLPGVQVNPDGNKAYWLPVLNSTRDQTCLAHFTQALPANASAQGSPLHRREQVVLDFLQHLLQAHIQATHPPATRHKSQWLQKWLTGLIDSTQIQLGRGKATQRLATTLGHWMLPLQTYLGRPDNLDLIQRQVRGAVALHPPHDNPGGPWHLAFGLQTLDNENSWIPATAIWQTDSEVLSWQQRQILDPQESLLRGLGMAARVYAPIAQSLEDRCPVGCDLDAIQAYEFILAIAAQLREQGLGVKLPTGLEQGGTAKRLGVKVMGQIQRRRGKRLTLQSLIDYDLYLVLGEGESAQALSADDFAGLLFNNLPLVEFHREWITLQPADVRAAQTILEQQQDPLPISVEGALQLSMGESQTIARLPVTQFAATGMLQELIETLQNPRGVKPIMAPPGFQGQLRPYQGRGVGWLAFLERWGLGACLADDMGLGKTPQLLALLLTLQAEEMLVNPVLIVCPTSVLSNWQHEIQKFTPGLNAILHHGDRRKKGQPLVRQVQHQQIVLTSYALLQRDISSLKLVDWQGVVLDEAQNIKNPQAKQSQAARELSAGFRIALTGTPVENRLTELWSILEFLNPGFLGTKPISNDGLLTPSKNSAIANRY